MVAVFLDLILKGLWSIEQVPTYWRGGVQEELDKLGGANDDESEAETPA